VERRPNLAVLDDSRFVLEQTKKTLGDAGYDVSCFLDPAALTHEVLDAAALVLVDVNMREVFGDDVIGFLKERLGVRAPVFLYSSIGEDGYEARAAADLRETAVLLLDFEPDIVVSDVHLAGIEGDHLCRQLKQSMRRLVPIVLYSSLPDSELAERARVAGADAYVVKHVGIAELIKRIDALLTDA
jgi:DNA-binding response OmpR family regulator